MKPFIPQRTGRKRAQKKSEEDLLLEAKAKGHVEKPGKPETRKPGDTFERKEDRGHQRGFGKNQGKEAIHLSTAHSTKGANLH